MSSFRSPPPAPSQSYYSLLTPEPYVLLVVFNRPKALNSIPSAVHHDLHALFDWYDNEPSLRVAIVTGAGRAFCAGADLKEWNETNKARLEGKKGPRLPMPASGFGGLSRRTGKKPVIGAINGLAHGGGMEAVVNLDIVVANKSAEFALPEVKRGVVAAAGALPRIVRTVGKMRAMEMALTGRTFTPDEGREWGWVNYVTSDHDWKSESKIEDVLKRPVTQKALEIARLITDNSPDSVMISRAGVAAGWEDGSAENATRVQSDLWEKKLAEGENIHEGVKAFVEKRKPQWRDSKL